MTRNRTRTRTTLAGLLLAGALLLAPGAAAQDADTPLDKALQKIEAALQTLKAQPNPDRKLIADLEEAAAQVRKARDAARAETPAPPPGGGGPGGGDAGGGVSDWAFRRGMESFLRGVELSPEDKTEAEEVLRDFYADYNLARGNDDNKSKGVVLEGTNRRIDRNFPRKDAGRMKDNLADIARFIERPWGRGGR